MKSINFATKQPKVQNNDLNIAPHAVETGEVFNAFGSNHKGLSNEEVVRRLKLYGPNRIEKKESTNVLLIYINQFKSPIALIILFASVLSFYFGEWLDGFAILAVLLINSGIGFYMEYKADSSMRALQKLATVSATVVRDNAKVEVNDEDLVPGDIVFIEAGNVISADGRLFSSSQLQVDESTLTGESIPVEKQTEIIQVDTVIAERNNMLFRGTFSTKGNGYMIVTATGMHTELGKIAKMVQVAKQPGTPLEKKLAAFSKKLIGVTIGLVALIFIISIINGHALLNTLQSSIALAVAAIPEGLPIVATITLAQGMMKMARHNVIVKKLSAVETLGGTNVICTDKTGTLTENKIEVSVVFTPEETQKSEEIMNRIAILCNTAEYAVDNNEIREIGDPLETGLLRFAIKNKYDIASYRKLFPKIEEVPFSSETRLMATLHQYENKKIVFAKGAVENILKKCSHILEKNGIRELTEGNKNGLLAKADELAGSGLRVIAGAYNEPVTSVERWDENLVFTGLFGMIDPPRKEVFDAVKECKSAGIKVVMITGDHPSTAGNVAARIGITESTNSNVITGYEMKSYPDLTETEKNKWLNTNVFARVSPEQKLDLITVLQERKNVVGMTGDGVNDAPALKKADIGIAMGLRGTQVAQEASDMVLKDDSFASIVVAIKQGRIIIENIRKFVIYLLSCNLSEILVIASTSIFSLHFQLLPLQILFINLFTDVFPALSLASTTGSTNVMNNPPADMNEPLIDRKRWNAIFFYAFVIGSTSIGAVLFSHFFIHQSQPWNHILCNNILFFTLIFSQLLHVLNMGSVNTKFFKSEITSNKFVWASIIISVIMLLLVFLIDPLKEILSIYNLHTADWLVCITTGFVSFLIIRLGKNLKIAIQ